MSERDKCAERRHNLAEELDPRRSRSFSPLTVHVCWLSFTALHLLCFAYFALFSWCYWNLRGSFLGVWFYIYNIGLGSDHDLTIAIVHGCLAAIHLFYLLWMLGWSIKKRKLVFAVYNILPRPTVKGAKESHWMHVVGDVYYRALSKSGVLGVDGPYFDLVLLCREVIETALQTQQAYRMSVLLPRTALNRGYAVLLVLNCWSTAIVHSVFRVDATRRRLLAVVCDCLLDLVTSVGITSTLLAIYYADFDFDMKGFPAHKWYEDVWVVHVLSEFQILLVNSWGDLTLRLIFALSMISNMNNSKKLLSAKLPKTKQTEANNHRITAVLSFHPSLADVYDSRTQSKLDVVLASESRISRVLFFLWGAAILVLHLHSEFLPELSQCKMQVRPWASSEPSCSLLVFDCYQSGVSGTADDAIAKWSGFDPRTTLRLVIRHCPNFEVPDALTKFWSLKHLKIYNSTIITWNNSSAISQKYHPSLAMLYIVRVNMTDGKLPTGLLGDDFPLSLTDIEFHTTNLRSLPDDFDLKWPQLSSIYFENCNFTEVPAPLVRLAPFDLSLALNPISDIPAALLERSFGFVHVGSTLISELPETVKEVSTSLVVRVDNTNVSFFWDWIEPILTSRVSTFFELHPILASNAPYCSDLQRIYSGEQTNFSVPWQQGHSIVLSDASEKNWATLRTAVSCDPWPTTWYPMDFEDEYSGIKT